jgi:hypothetical protein
VCPLHPALRDVLKLINFKEFGFNLQRLLNPQGFNLSFPQRIWAWVDKKKK